MLDFPLAAAFSSLMIFFLPCSTWYSGAKSCSMSTPNLLFGKSMTCPTDAFTWNSRPRYFWSVRAFAGDSTITRFFAIPSTLSRRRANVNRHCDKVLSRQLLYHAGQLQPEQVLKHDRRRQTAAPDDGVNVQCFVPHA